MLRYTRFVWILLYAQLFYITTAWFSEAAALHHHEEISSMSKGLIRSPDSGLHTSKNVYGWCRRCLRIQDDEALSPPVAEEAPPVTSRPVTAPPPLAATDLPTLPTDPDAHPAAPRTNPSSLLITPSGTSVPGLGEASSSSSSNMKSSSSVLAGKVGFSAGVGLTAGVGLGVLLLGVLYYFKPDLFFLCCKTCVRVQVFHHSAPANANSKK